ncbi:MAG: Uma2 family endonuclease [Isosphaeraceae bacterium]
MATISHHRLSPADHGRALTLGEFLDAEEQDGFRYELARGVVEVTEVPNDPHADVEWFLLKSLTAYDQGRPGLIHRVSGGGSVRLWLPGMVSGRNPDIAVVLQGAPKDDRDRRIPALAMEIVSEGRDARQRDYVTKREEYLAYGLLEYWIIDRFDRRATVLTRHGDLWLEHVFHDGQTASGLVLPGFAVPVAEIWPTPE